MKRNKYIFLRNDDVRDRLDEELITLTDICLKHQIPISHAVEPANVSRKVIDWLLIQKEKYPELIEIMQHGYDHNLKNPSEKMEYGGNRSYEDQLITMQKGKKLMDVYFGENWSPIFTFPYGSYNSESLKAVNTLEYKAISTKISFSTKQLLKNKLGTLLGKDFIVHKKVSYHPKKRKGYQFSELSVSSNLIRRYTGYDTAIHYSIDEVRGQISTASRHTDIIGILFHHRFHKHYLPQIDNLLTKLKDDYNFSTIMNLIR